MYFHQKNFQGETYTFSHLNSETIPVFLNSGSEIVNINVVVTYSCHCFTESFDTSVHGPHHTYKFDQETRAFDLIRYKCSLQLPAIIQETLRARVHRANRNNYTYVVHTPVPSGGNQQYSIFFDLKKDTRRMNFVHMYVQSAYLSPLKGGPQQWRFKSLIGEISGVFQPKTKKLKPQKKKAP